MSVVQPNTAVVELAWVKSSYSGPDGGQCVEVAGSPGAVHVRDSKDAVRAMLAFGAAQWDAFLGFAAKE